MPKTITLAPPGAGLRWYERLVAQGLLRTYVRRTSEREALALFWREGDRLLAIARGLPAGQLGERVLVPRLPGLEDSSRYWSVAMALEHLEIVNGHAAELVVELARGEVRATKLAIAEVKPHAEVDAAGAVASFAASLERYAARVGARALPMDTATRFPHPWFGPATAHAWLCFAGLHQRIHRKQVEAIARGLGKPGPRVIETRR